MKNLTASWRLNNPSTNDSWTVHFDVRREDGYYLLSFQDDKSEWTYRLYPEQREAFLTALGEHAKWPTQAMRRVIARGEGAKIQEAARETLPKDFVWVDTVWDD